MEYVLTAIALAVVLAVVWFVRHQRSLRQRAELMREAIANRDFMFRLPTRGLPVGERAMQESLNRLGSMVQQQVNQNEVESWERLTRVLTHEIMNATAPIASISQSLLARNDVRNTPLEDGIRAIHTAAQHLNNFVDSYRKFSHLQKMEPRPTRILTVIDEVRLLFPGVEWQVQVPGEATVHADPNMLRQILMNLTKNAVEAGARRMGIALDDATAPSSRQPHWHSDDGIALSVSNDGQPIPAEAWQSVFVPFFTTKRSGNGIGLSLSRKMMTQQGGSLELLERPRGGFHTTFMLTFPRWKDNRPSLR